MTAVDDELAPAPRPTSVGHIQRGLEGDVVWKAGISLLGIGALAAWLGLRPLAGLFSRFSESDVLDHPVRRRILEVVQQRPGIHFADLIRTIDVSHGVLTHHLRMLSNCGKLTARSENGYACYFAAGAVDRRVMAAMPWVKAASARQVLRAVVAKPGLSVSEVAEQVSGSPSAIHHHLRKLQACGLVRRQREGRKVCHFPEQLAEDVLAQLVTRGRGAVTRPAGTTPAAGKTSTIG